MRLVDLTPQRVGEVLREIDAEAAAERTAHEGFDRAPWVALIVGTLCLVLMEYAGTPTVLVRWLQAMDPAGEGALSSLLMSRWGELVELAWWVSFRVLGFALLPILAIRFLLRERLSEHGLRTSGLRGHWGLYLSLFALVLPLVLLAGTRPEFVRYYPFYRRASESYVDFASWELLYAAQFVALELFFRGFMLSSCRRAMGSNAIAVMIVPYCMLHFQKPVLEVLGAIVAGFVLGVLALRTRSIWGGIALHVSVAVLMDVTALVQSTGLPTRWLPVTQ